MKYPKLHVENRETLVVLGDEDLKDVFVSKDILVYPLHGGDVTDSYQLRAT